jgi:hypothetical protein
MVADIQSRKMLFMQEYLRLNDEQIIDKLSDLLHKEKSKMTKVKFKPRTQDELEAKLNRSEKNIENGEIYSQIEVENFFKNRFQ